MKPPFLITIGVLALLLQGVSAQTSLFTTMNDFVTSSNANFMVTPASAIDLDGKTINGLGNPTAAGLSGTPGSASLTWQSGTYDYVYLTPGEAGNAPFIAALENCSTLSYDYTTPAAGTGNYFNPGLVLNYQSSFDQLGGTATSLGGGVTRVTFNFATEAAKLITKQAANGGTFSYFSLGIIYNSNYNATNSPFTVDNFQVTPAPEPATVALLGVGLAGLISFRRRHY